MLSPELASGLSAYNIGSKLRALRLKRKMGLVELGQHTGLSPALLSKIERSRLFPTLPTLLRVATVFSVGLEHFFAREDPRPAPAITHRGERQRFPEGAEMPSPAYYFESLDYPAVSRKLNAYLAEFCASNEAEWRVHTHPGAEFLYVMSGQLGMRVDAAEYVLSTGDSIYFDADLPHGYRRLGEAKCHAVVITVPEPA